MEQNLSTVHEALNDAALERKAEKPKMITCTYKVPKDLKKQASEICSRNGTTLGTYLRKCCERLVKDYQP